MTNIRKLEFRFIYLLLIFSSCRMNQISTVSSSVLLNFDEPSIYVDYSTVFIDNKRQTKINLEFVPNQYTKNFTKDSLTTFGITLGIQSKNDSISINKHIESSFVLGKLSTVLEFIYPVSSPDYSINLSIASNSLLKDKDFTLLSIDKLNTSNTIGDIEVGYFLPDSKFMKYVRYVTILDTVKKKYFQISHKYGISDSVKIKLKKLHSDDEIARPLHSRQYSTTSLVFKGIDYTKSEIESELVTKLNSNAEITLIPLVDIALGNYEFELWLKSNSQKWELHSKKSIAFFKDQFPYYTAIKDQIEPYQYILPENVFNQIMSISDPNEMETTFLNYFKKEIGNQKIIREVLSKYSTRVEEANYFFTNFKDGWKTDMGMVYIIYGPPLFVMRKYDSVFWNYSHQTNDPFRVFTFRRIRLNSAYFPFDHYLANRNPDYFQLNYSRINDWRTGAILRYDRF
jgi:GWxTD domain-containing protein